MPARDEALERARLASRSRSLSSLQGQFTNTWFPGGEAFQEPVIRVHDAAHQWANISPSARGELQQAIVDMAGTQRLYEGTGARGFINSMPFGVGGITADDFDEDVAGESIQMLVNESARVEDPIKGVPTQSGLPVNSPARLQLPPISPQEARELIKRGREFYGGVGQELNTKALKATVRNADPNRVTGAQPFSPAPGLEGELPVNAQAEWVHRHGGDIRLKGGYDAPGRMPYGPIEARLNRPLQYTVDEGILMRDAAKEFYSRLEAEKNKLAARSTGMSPGGLEEGEKWFRSALSSRFGLPDFVGDSFFQDGVNAKEWFADHDRTIRNAEAFGSGNEVSALQYVMRDKNDADALDIAARARDLTKVKNAARIGFNAATDLVGSVPLFDPEFRQAVETGNVRKAGERVAQEYATGLLAAPVVGMGAGALQRLAPATAAQVLPAVATGARIGNPVAVVSQLGGSAKPSQRQRAEEKRLDPGAFGAQGPSANPQLLRAEAARRRGGKWKLGPFTVPELGLSEAGGLFFR
jgi:hypothetical protein